jgi:lipopolysaccharide export LptBFGC system permease protein LptF
VKLVSRYFLVRFLGYFFAILTVLMLLILIADLLLNLDNILDQAEGSIGALALALALRTPARYLPILIPLASFAGAFMALGLAARWHEVTALKAGGVSPLRIAVPLLLAALLLSGAALALDETVVVQAARALHAGNDDATPITFRRGSFWYQTGRTIYNLRQADPDAGTLEGVSVYELDERGRLVRILRAPRGHVDPSGHWVLQDAVSLGFDPAWSICRRPRWWCRGSRSSRSWTPTPTPSRSRT